MVLGVGRSEQLIGEAANLIQYSIIADGRSASCDAIREYLRSDPFQNNQSACFVAYRKGIPVGVICVEFRAEDPEEVYFVRNLYTVPSERGGSVAISLLKKAASWAKREDALVCITTYGDPRAYYRGLGFEPFAQVSATTVRSIKEKLGV